MSSPSKNRYAKLPGRGRRRRTGVTASPAFTKGYLGEDHLLVVESDGFLEKYKRFYFKDIQAIVVQKIPYWRPTIYVTHIGLVLLLILAALTDSAIQIVMVVLSIVVGLMVSIDALRGKLCFTEIRTSVQKDQLAFMGRWRVALKCLQILKPLIEAAQPQPVPNPDHASQTSVENR